MQPSSQVRCSKNALITILGFFLSVSAFSEPLNAKLHPIWSVGVPSIPTAIHYSSKENLIYIFGRNSKSMVLLSPLDGSVMEKISIDFSLSREESLITRNVAVHELHGRMNYAIFTLEVSVGYDEGKNDIFIGNTKQGSRLVCWDFGTRSVKWAFHLSDSLLSLPDLATTANSPIVSNEFVIQHFSAGEVYALDAHSGNIIWNNKYPPIGGFVLMNGFLYGGVWTERGGTNIFPGLYKIDAETGDLVDRYRFPNPCIYEGPTMRFTIDDNLPGYRASDSSTHHNCNNVWSKPSKSKSGGYFFILDDLFGLMKFDAKNVSHGPLWSNAFVRELSHDSNSQQSFFSPTVSSDDKWVYATAYHTTVAISSKDGTTLWLRSQEGSLLTREIIISQSGDLILFYNFSVHILNATNGELISESDPSLLDTFGILNFDDNNILAAGLKVSAFTAEVARELPTSSPILMSELHDSSAFSASILFVMACWITITFLVSGHMF
jgi:outer membrane protein assembly factor BamB